MKDEKKVYKKNKDFVTRQIDKDMILMPIYKTNKDINEMYTLNETAADMWELIDGKKTVKDMCDDMSKKYDVARDKLEADVEEFIKDMKEIKAIQ